MSPDSSRKDRILDAARELMMHFGYDKTTVSEIADQAGVSKGAIYLHFDSKGALFEALLIRELVCHSKAWIEAVEEDPEGGTLGGLYRSSITVREGSPLIAAMIKQSAKILGSYMHEPGNLFEQFHSLGMGPEVMRDLQEAGCIRDDVDPVILAHIGDVLDYGMMGIGEIKDESMMPPFEEVVEGIAQMMERAFAPPGGGDSEAGKKVMRRYADLIQQYMAQMSGDEASVAKSDDERSER